MLDYLYSALANPTVSPDVDWNWNRSKLTTPNNKNQQKVTVLQKQTERTEQRSDYGSVTFVRKQDTETKGNYQQLVDELDTIPEEEDGDEEMVVEMLWDKLRTKLSGQNYLKLKNADGCKSSEDRPLIREHLSNKIFSSKKMKGAGKRIRKALRKSISYLAMGLANMTTYVLVPTNIPSPMYHCREYNPYY